MKKISLLILLVAVMAQAQVQRFIYDYRYVPDLAKKDSVASDMMVLDIDAKGSVYQSLNRIKMDSVMREQFRNFTPASPMARVDIRGMRRGTIGYKVTKEYPSFKTFLNERIGRDNYKILENEKQNWTISPETLQIGDYKTQKATTKWGGREWVAWFCTDLPFQDGPYKFSGLPGLIIKIEDATGSHAMTLVANKNIAVPVEEATVRSNGNRGNFSRQEIEITEDQFKKAYANYIADPARDLRNMMSGGGGANGPRIRMSRDGKEIKPDEMIKRMEKEVKDNELHNNNRIEPTLYDSKK